MISPIWKTKLWWNKEFLGGSWNIAFIREDQQDDGTIAHELAHTIGQGREFYKSKEKCHPFRGSFFATCESYKIPRALDTWVNRNGQNWKFLKDKFSIMTSESGIDNLWIDRETYQKTFQVLSGKAVIPPNEKLYRKLIKAYSYQREQYSSSKAIITGFYYKEKNAFISSSIKVRKTKLLTPSFSSDTRVYKVNFSSSFFSNMENTTVAILTFQLREGQKILQEIKRSFFEMQIKTLYENHAPKIENFEFSPGMAIFNLPQDYRQRNLSIVILNHKGKQIYSAPIPIKKTAV